MSFAQLSPLESLERAFDLLIVGPKPLSVDGGRVVGLPSRAIPLDELRSMLLHPSSGRATRNAAMSLLVKLAQTGAAKWRVGLAGVLLPGLWHIAWRMSADSLGEPADLEAELLTGLLETLDGFDAEAGLVSARLLQGAYNAARRLCSREAAEAGRRACGTRAHPPPRPRGHPDLVLAQAVAARVLSDSEAELISATRLGRASLARLAAADGVAPNTLYRRRRRAELRVAHWLRRAA